jgi:hypothetical protein
MIALAEYPSLAAMKEMVESSDYREIATHRDAGLVGQLTINWINAQPDADSRPRRTPTAAALSMAG